MPGRTPTHSILNIIFTHPNQRNSLCILQSPNSERDSIMPYAVKSSFKTGSSSGKFRFLTEPKAGIPKNYFAKNRSNFNCGWDEVLSMARIVQMLNRFALPELFSPSLNCVILVLANESGGSFLLNNSTRARICRPFKVPRNRFPAWRAGTKTPFSRTGLPGYIGWRLRFLGNDSLAP